MLPYIHLINRDVPVYGLLMAVGGGLGWLISVYRAQRHVPQLSREAVTRFYLIFLAGALIGAKVYSLILVWPVLTANISLLWSDPQLFLQMFVYGGMVFYGGLIGGALCVVWLLLSHRVTFTQLETIYLPVVPLVHGIGRIGCFCAGCCYGVPAHSFLGVIYPEGGFAPAGIPLVPIQLFESAGDFILCGVLCLPVYRQPGRRLSVYLLGYGCLRFATERFRGDAARGLAGPLSGAQWISLACIAAGVLMTSFLYLRPRIQQAGSPGRKTTRST